MHNAVKHILREIKKELPHKFRFRNVLEVGSHNINGSPRKYFWFCNYTGIDISKGKGVDLVGKLSDLYNEYVICEQYDVVVSTEMLEHDSQWNMSLYIMYQLLKSGGLMIITCASDERLEHGTNRTTPECSPDTTDYYRNISKQDFQSVLPSELFSLYVLMNGRDKQDLYFYGIKK
jgi:hypothetical protein